MPTFNIDEVFEMACQIERIGSAFYARAAEVSHEVRQQRVLRGLSDWEREHEKLFRGMLERVPEDRRVEMYDPTDEALLYMRAMVEGKVFDAGADPSQRLSGRESYNQILDIAIGMEKNSIAFYLGIQQLIRSEADRREIAAILREEMRHVTILAGEKEKTVA